MKQQPSDKTVENSGWVGVFGPLHCTRPDHRPKTFWERLSPKEKKAYAAWYKFNKEILGV